MAEYRSGSFTTNHETTYNDFSLTFHWSLVSQSIEDNTSTISFYVAYESGVAYDYRSLNSNYGLLNGERKNGTIGRVYHGDTVASGTIVVPHKTDGTKTFSASWYVQTTTPRDLSGSGSWDLPSIPRGSVITSVSNGNVEENISINLQGFLADYTEIIDFSIDNTNWTEIADRQCIVGLNTLTYTLPSSLYAEIPTKTQKGYIRVRTFNEDEEQIGLSSIQEFTITAISTPTITNVSIEDINSITGALTGNNNIIVSGYSNMKIGATATPNNSATITSLKVNGINIVSGYGTIEKCNTSVITIVATDSRGYSASYTIPNLTLKEYFEPTNNITITRNAPTDGIVNFSGNGNYWNQNFGSQANTLTIRYKYKKQTEQNYSNWETITPIISGNTYQVNQQKSTIDYEYVYNFVIEVIDKITTLSREYVVIKGKPIFYIKEDGIYDGATDEPYIHGQGGGGGDSLPIGFISGWGTDTPPDGWLICDGGAISRTAYSELFSVIGTYWGAGDGTTTFNVPNMKGRVLVGQDLGDSDFSLVGSYLGEKTHTLTTNEIPSHNHIVTRATTTYGPGTQSAWRCLSWSGTNHDYGDVVSSESTGGGQAHNNLQPLGVGNYIIKYAQVSTEALPSEAGIPVGSILEFNGTEEQIPVGYAKLDDGGEQYSTDEKVIGKWIDGKTLYRKVIKRENISLSSSTLLSNSTMADLNEMTKIDVVGKKGNDYNLIAKAHPTTLNWSIGAYYSNGWYIEAGSSASGTWAFITIIVEYTKTTD